MSKKIRMKFLGDEMKSKLDFVLDSANDAFETFKEKGNISTSKPTIDTILQLAQLITLLEVNEKLQI